MSEAFWSGRSEALESERLFEESEVIMNLFNTSARVAGRNSRIYAKAATNLNNRYGMPRFWDTVESISVKKQVSFCLEALCCLPYFGRCLNRGNRVGGVEFLLETEAWSRRTDAGRFGFGDSASVRYGSAVLFRWFGFSLICFGSEIWGRFSNNGTARQQCCMVQQLGYSSAIVVWFSRLIRVNNVDRLGKVTRHPGR